MEQIIAYYNKGLELLPPQYRVIIAAIILIFLIYALINFFKKNWLWIIFFLLLLPAAYPSLRQIGLALWSMIQKVPK